MGFVTVGIDVHSGLKMNMDIIMMVLLFHNCYSETICTQEEIILNCQCTRCSWVNYFLCLLFHKKKKNSVDVEVKLTF